MGAFTWNPNDFTGGGGGTGNVVGPGSSTDNAVTRYDGTTGKIIQNSTVTLTDAGSMQGLNELQMNSGSAGDPPITFTGDTNLGIFRKAADSLGFAAAGSEIGNYSSSGDWTFGLSTSNIHIINGCFSYPININTFTGTSTNFGNTPRYRKLTNAGTKTIQGIAAGEDGQELTFFNEGGNATIVNESGSATADRRIITGSGADIVLTSDGCVNLYYDTNSSRWRVTSFVN